MGTGDWDVGDQGFEARCWDLRFQFLRVAGGVVWSFIASVSCPHNQADTTHCPGWIAKERLSVSVFAKQSNKVAGGTCRSSQIFIQSSIQQEIFLCKGYVTKWGGASGFGSGVITRPQLEIFWSIPIVHLFDLNLMTSSIGHWLCRACVGSLKTSFTSVLNRTLWWI